MSKQIPWTKTVLNNFEEMAMLSEAECYVLESRCKGATVTEQALYLHKSESTVHRMISSMKKKYDRVQKENPDMFPKRRVSKAEEYMDTH